MTPEELRELDAWIAEHVMGHTVAIRSETTRMPKLYSICKGSSMFRNVPSYSTDLSAAFEVIEAIRARFPDCEDFDFTVSRDNDGYCAEVYYLDSEDTLTFCGSGEVDTASLAICLAAKKVEKS